MRFERRREVAGPREWEFADAKRLGGARSNYSRAQMASPGGR